MLAVATGMATAHDPPSDNPRGTPEEVQRATSEDICVRAAEEEGVCVTRVGGERARSIPARLLVLAAMPSRPSPSFKPLLATKPIETGTIIGDVNDEDMLPHRMRFGVIGSLVVAVIGVGGAIGATWMLDHAINEARSLTSPPPPSPTPPPAPPTPPQPPAPPPSPRAPPS